MSFPEGSGRPGDVSIRAFGPGAPAGVSPEISEVVTSEPAAQARHLYPVAVPRDRPTTYVPQEAAVSSPIENKTPATEAVAKVRALVTAAEHPDEPMPVRLARTRTANWIDGALGKGIFGTPPTDQSENATESTLAAKDVVTVYGAVADGSLADGQHYSLTQIAEQAGTTFNVAKRGVTGLRDTGTLTPWERGPHDPKNPQSGYTVDARNITRPVAVAVGDETGTNDVAAAVADLHEQVSAVASPDDPPDVQLYRTAVLNAVDDALAGNMLVRSEEPIVDVPAHAANIPPMAVQMYTDLVDENLAPGEMYPIGRLLARYGGLETDIRRGVRVLQRAGIATTHDSGDFNGAYTQGGFSFNTNNMRMSTEEERTSRVRPTAPPPNGVASKPEEQRPVIRDAKTGRLRPQTIAEMDGVSPDEDVDTIQMMVDEDLDAIGRRSAAVIAKEYGLPYEKVRHAVGIYWKRQSTA